MVPFTSTLDDFVTKRKRKEKKTGKQNYPGWTFRNYKVQFPQFHKYLLNAYHVPGTLGAS